LVCAAVVNVHTMLVPLRLPLVILPVTDKLVNVPTDVMLVCAAVVNVPTILVPLRLPPIMLPEALTIPVTLTLPVELTVVPASVIVVTLDDVAILIPLTAPDQGIIENPTLPTEGPEANNAMSPVVCKLLYEPFVILPITARLFVPLCIANALPDPATVDESVRVKI